VQPDHGRLAFAIVQPFHAIDEPNVPPPWAMGATELELLADDAGINPEQLREHLRAEIERLTPRGGVAASPSVPHGDPASKTRVFSVSGRQDDQTAAGT
jgi:hypothetical protein